MPAFAKPDFDDQYDYDAATQIAAIDAYMAANPAHQIPARSDGHLLVGSWNIANFGDGGQPRDMRDLQVIAATLARFDIAAVQEIKADLAPLRQVLGFMPSSYRFILTDRAGNNERLAFFYDSAKVTKLELAGEIAVPPASHKHIKLPGVTECFIGFDRNPFAVAFEKEGFEITIANAHSYFGKTSPKALKLKSIQRRQLETFALGRWARLEQQSDFAFAGHAMVIGDLNMPKAEKGDPIYDALRSQGLKLPDHPSRVGTTIHDEAHYDQLAFFKGPTSRAFRASGVHSFDNAVFADLWGSFTGTTKEKLKKFKPYLRYHLSDHRPIWAQFATG